MLSAAMQLLEVLQDSASRDQTLNFIDIPQLTHGNTVTLNLMDGPWLTQQKVTMKAT